MEGHAPHEAEWAASDRVRATDGQSRFKGRSTIFAESVIKPGLPNCETQ